MYGKHDKWWIQYLGLDGHWRTMAKGFRTKSLAEIEMERMNKHKSESIIGQGRYRVRRQEE